MTQERAQATHPGSGFRAVLLPTRDALAAVPMAQAKELEALPLAFEGRCLVLASATARPEQAQAALQRPVKIVRARAEAVSEAIERSYAAAPVPEADELVRSVTAEPARKVTPAKRPHRLALQQPLKVLAITSGKGGVGKTSITANLGIALAQTGARTLAMDCDFGLSNLHLALGVEPQATLADVLLEQVDMPGAIAEGPEGLDLIGGASGASEMAQISYPIMEKRGASYSQFAASYDFLLVDTAAGIQDGAMTLMEAAHETIIVMTPEPASVQDAYMTAGSLVSRKPKGAIQVIVNQADSEAQSRAVFARFLSFLRQHRGGSATFMSWIPHDREARKASLSRMPYILAAPKCPASRAVRAIAEGMVQFEEPQSEDRGWLSRLLGGDEKHAA